MVTTPAITVAWYCYSYYSTFSLSLTHWFFFFSLFPHLSSLKSVQANVWQKSKNFLLSRTKSHSHLSSRTCRSKITTRSCWYCHDKCRCQLCVGIHGCVNPWWKKPILCMIVPCCVNWLFSYFFVRIEEGPNSGTILEMCWLWHFLEVWGGGLLMCLSTAGLGLLGNRRWAWEGTGCGTVGGGCQVESKGRRCVPLSRPLLPAECERYTASCSLLPEGYYIGFRRWGGRGMWFLACFCVQAEGWLLQHTIVESLLQYLCLAVIVSRTKSMGVGYRKHSVISWNKEGSWCWRLLYAVKHVSTLLEHFGHGVVWVLWRLLTYALFFEVVFSCFLACLSISRILLVKDSRCPVVRMDCRGANIFSIIGAIVIDVGFWLVWTAASKALVRSSGKPAACSSRLFFRWKLMGGNHLSKLVHVLI